MNGKNAILITIECVREDIARSNGFLQNLRTKGKKFSNAFSASSWTAPSIMSILTSTYPMMFRGTLELKPPRRSIQEVLSRNGYFTAGFTYHPYLTKSNGYDRGFNVYEWSLNDISSVYGEKNEELMRLNKPFLNRLRKLEKLIFKAYIPYGMRIREHLHFMRRYRGYLRNNPYELGKAEGEGINEKVTKELSTIGGRKNFFVWIHYSEPHFPFSPPTEYLPKDISRKKCAMLNARRYFARMTSCRKLHRRLSDEDIEGLKKLYTSELKVVNDQINFLIKNLDSLGLLSDTGIFITSDHGEAFYEHKRFHHTFHLYDELIHVPLWIIGPDVDAEEVNMLSSHIDLAPTIVDFLGIPKPPTWIGESVLSSDYIGHTTVFSETTEEVADKEILSGHMNILKGKISARSKHWKYIYNKAEPNELYNLEQDPGESTNLVNTQPKVCRMMKKLIQAHINSERAQSRYFTNLHKKITKIRTTQKKVLE